MPRKKKDPKEISLKFRELMATENIATLLTEEQLKSVGARVVDDYRQDKTSRTDWEKKNKQALDLALQVMETKSYPWPNAANIKFPLLTIAALQFSARVYPALIQSPDIAKYRIMGTDPSGAKASRALRVGRFISYQLLEQDEGWEEAQDRLFIALPILGCVFKKTYYDPITSKVCSKLVLPNDLVVHYYAKDLIRSRVTEVFELYPNEIKERKLKGVYLDTELVEETSKEGDPKEQDSDKRQGLTVPFGDAETPRQMLEYHGFFDFDNDGLKEPYTVTVDLETELPLRIKNRFKEVISKQSIQITELKKQSFLLAQSLPPPQLIQQAQQAAAQGNQQAAAMVQQAHQRLQEVQKKVNEANQEIEALQSEDPDLIRIEPKVFYTKYSFIPTPDGGFYDLGFGQLLGPLNSSVNTIINQLIDAGTMQVGTQGFIGKGARIQGGTVRFEPFEWKRVNVAGQTLKESIVPLPINPPSDVLFNLLGMLVNYSERVSSVTDMMTGESPGQNTPAFNMKAMLEQGMQVFNGVFKRIYRSFRSELRKVYALNGEYLNPEEYVETMDGEYKVLQKDFWDDPKDLIPAADPNAFSSMEKLYKAQVLKQEAMTSPGFNMVNVEKRVLEAFEIPDLDEVYPTTPDGQLAIPPQPNPELEMQKAELQHKVLETQARTSIDAAVAHADIELKEAQAQNLHAETKQVGKPDPGDAMKAQQEKIKGAMDIYMKKIDVLLKQMELKLEQQKAVTQAVKAKANAAEAKNKEVNDGSENKSKPA